MTQPLDALIVGAGPTGLTLAALLARHGLTFRIIDRNGGPSGESRATDMHVRTLELFAHLGIARRLIACGRRAHRVNFHGADGPIAQLDITALDTPYPFILGIPQDATERILLDELLSFGHRGVERDTCLTDLHQPDDPDGPVTATVTGPGGRHEAIEARWLIGCDGASSTVRQLLALPFAGVTYPEAFMLADIDIDWALPRDELHTFFSPTGFVTVLPMPGERTVRLFVDLPEGQQERQPDLDTFRALFAERVPAPATLYTPGWMSRFRVHRRMVPRYQVGRVFLAGDAAHIHSPVGGQGMNTGVQDAFNLAWKLALVARGHAPTALLDSYHAERHPVGAMTLLETDVATRMSTLRDPTVCWLRDRLSAMTMSLAGLSHLIAQVTAELHVNVRSSPIVAASRSSLLAAEVVHNPDTEHASVAEWLEFGWGPEAGDRAPDRAFGPAHHKRDFHTLLGGTHHALMLFDGAATTNDGYANLARIAAAVRQRFGHVVHVHVAVPRPDAPASLLNEPSLLRDPEGDLHCAFGARAECAYLIRPDGYIAWRSQPAALEPILAYLSRHFRAVAR